MPPGPKAPPFDERYIPEPNSGCWLWTGGLGRGGYGKIKHNQRTYRAHRFSWMLHRGEIPKGMLVLHKCDTPLCVNPDHLFLGTDADNSRDRDQKGHGMQGERHHRAKLAVEDVLKIRADTRILREIAQDYGVSLYTIWDAKHRSWQILN